MTPGYYYCCCDSFGRSRPKRQQRLFDPIHDPFCLWGCFTRVRRRRRDFSFCLDGSFSVCRSIRSRVCCWRSFGILLFSRGHETQTTLGRELFSLLPSSSFFLLCGSLYGRLCALKRTRPAAVYIELSERWMEGRKKGHEKRQPRTYYTSPQTLDVHSVLLRWVANSTRNSPPKQTSKQSPTLFVFLKCVQQDC